MSACRQVTLSAGEFWLMMQQGVQMPMDIPNSVNPIAAILVMLAGSVWGLRYDPLTWLLFVACITFGALRWRVYTPLVAAAFATSLVVYSVGWAKLSNYDQRLTHSIWIFSVLLIVTCVGYGVGSLISVGMKRRRS